MDSFKNTLVFIRIYYGFKNGIPITGTRSFFMINIK